HPAPPSLHTLSLHDALPILLEKTQVIPGAGVAIDFVRHVVDRVQRVHPDAPLETRAGDRPQRSLHRLLLVEVVRRLEDVREPVRSEEHTSELQSLTNLVCRL